MPIYCKQSFVLTLLVINQQTYTMKRTNENPDAKFNQIILDVLENKIAEHDWKQKIQSLLQQKANINCNIKTNNIFEPILGVNIQRTALYLAAQNLHENLVDYLLVQGANPNTYELDYSTENGSRRHILNTMFTKLATSDNHSCIQIIIEKLLQYGADPNADDSFPLYYSINYKPEFIKILCNAGASLLNLDKFGNNAFHTAAFAKLPKHYIEMFMIHGHTPLYDQQEDEKLKKRVKETLLLFERIQIQISEENRIIICKLPRDIQLRILSYLTLGYCSGFDKKLSEYTVKMGHYYPILIHTKNQIDYLEKLIHRSNKKGETAFSLLYVSNYDENYITEVKDLFNGSIIQKSKNKLITIFSDIDIAQIPVNDIVRKIYTAKTQLLSNQSSFPT